ncbi:MAG: glycosyltransferase family 4 protein [Candidatus Njordarchaeales archaeon]
MLKKENTTLIFLMSYGTSLETWQKIGIFTREIKVIKELAKLYGRVLIISYDDKECREYLKHFDGNISILCKPRPLPNLTYSILAPLIHRRRIRGKRMICRTVQLWGFWTGLIMKIIYGCRLILRQGFTSSKFAIRSRDLKYYILATIFELIAYHMSDRIIVTTKQDKEYIIKRYHVKPCKIYVIPNWVDTSLFKPKRKVEKEEGRIIFVGRLERQKNIFALINAIKTIPQAKLYLVGDGSLKEEIIKKIREENIGNVFLLGPIPHNKLPEELNKSEIFILPSLYEGHPKTLIEAMACGLPVIGTKVEGIRENIKNGENGLLCDINYESIREKIRTLLENKEMGKKLGVNARKHILKEYSLEKVLEREILIHLSLIKGK